MSLLKKSQPRNRVERSGRKLILNYLLSAGLFLAVITVYPAAAQTWTQVNVANTNWFTIVSSADGSILYASGGNTNSQQVYTSTNSGTTWNQTTQPTTNSVWGLAVSADGTKLFATRGLPGYAPFGATNNTPFFVSSDSGLSWNPIGLPMTNYIYSTAMSADGNVLVAGIQSPRPYLDLIYISTNTGATWSTNLFPSGNYHNVLITANGQKILAFISPNGLLTTTDAGTTWTTNNLPASSYTWRSIAGSANGNMLAAIGHKSLGTFVCLSTNAGTSWTTSTVSAFAYNPAGNIAMSADGSMLIAPTSGAVFLSTNFGLSWLQSFTLTTNWNVTVSSADGKKLVIAALGVTDFKKATGAIWTSQTTPSPQLNAASFLSNLALKWTIPSTNFVLQQSSDLVSWTNVANPPILNLTNLQNEVMISPTNSSSFYRLKTP